MKNTICILLFYAFFGHVVHAQIDSLNVLGTVHLVKYRIKDSVYTTNVRVLNDSVLRQNQASLRKLLNYNPIVNFKEKRVLL